MRRAATYRFSLYFLLNIAFALLVAVGYAVGGLRNPHFVYLVLLFAICANAVIDFDGINGRFALLALFMLIFFVSYGVGDFVNLWTGVDTANVETSRSEALSKTEVVILIGGIMLVFGYRLAVQLTEMGRAIRTPNDWPKSAVLWVGLLFWVIGSIATYQWYVDIVSDTTNEALEKGLSSISAATTTAYLLAQMCQPLGMLLLAYAYRVYRNAFMLPVMAAVVLVQLFIGFVADVKGLAILGVVLVIITSVLVNGRLPKAWLLAFALFAIFLFPFFQAYRTAVHGDSGLSRTAVVANFGKALELTIAAKDKVNTGRDRAQTFLERSSVKGSTEIIVQKAGEGVDFQRGHTLSPILVTFIPKIIWSDKLRIPTGQLFNKQFHITDSDDVYISPSHLGELYWNFGWSGVLLGMTAIGLICGWVGARFHLAEFTTITRVLVSVITMKQLILSFEGAIADNYVVWLRSMAAIGILHLIFARIPAMSRWVQSAGSRPDPDQEPAVDRTFANLLT